MLKLITVIILCIFAVFGVWHIFCLYISDLFSENKKTSVSPSLVFTVKNCRGDIEFILRSFIWKHYLNSSDSEIPAISVVDLGSDDGTALILKKLEREYDFLNVYDKQSYIKMIEQQS